MIHQLNNFINTSMDLLDKPDEWQSLKIDYYPPQVDRLWKQIGENRVYLHKIYKTENDLCLFHKHKWPSAIYILFGSYEMGISYCEKEVTNDEAHSLPVAAKFIMAPGSSYEMVETHGLHYVKPLTDYSLSIMISGPLYPEKRIESLDRELVSLSDVDIRNQLSEFKNQWPPKMV